MKNVIALVLAGGRMGHYGVLTRNRAKAALPFAANYRIIDFALSSLRHSQIDRIGIIIQYLPASLIEHVGVGAPWDLHLYGRTLKIMPPFVGIEHTAWYKGTADALYQNLNFIYDANPEIVIVLSGEHVYNYDFAHAVAVHRDSNADVTMVVRDLPRDRCACRFGFVQVEDGGRISSFHEKPNLPSSRVISTGIYVFRRSLLVDLLKANARQENHNLARDVLQPAASQAKCVACHMEGYWEYMENVGEYFDVQFDLMKPEQFEMLGRWGIITNTEYRGVGFAPAALCGPAAHVGNVIAGSGCRIEGTVENSILSPGVIVEKGAVIRNSILMHDCVVGENAHVENTVSDKDVHFLSGSVVGMGEAEGPCSTDMSSALFGPLALIGKSAVIGEGVRIPRGSQVRIGGWLTDQETAEAHFKAGDDVIEEPHRHIRV